MIVTKAQATVETVESENPNGEFDVILSTNDLDRDGEHLNADEWKTPLPEHITFDSDHGMSVDTTVGSGKPFINSEGQLQVRGTFASTAKAQEVRTLVNEGHIRSVSVAFMETKSKGAKNSPSITRELLNGAFVAVPANPKAVVLASKSVSTDELGELMTRAAKVAVAEYITQTSTPEGGTPQESAEESAAESAEATDEESAAPADDAADDSADDAVLRARALAVSLSATALSAITDTKE